MRVSICFFFFISFNLFSQTSEMFLTDLDQSYDLLGGTDERSYFLATQTASKMEVGYNQIIGYQILTYNNNSGQLVSSKDLTEERIKLNFTRIATVNKAYDIHEIYSKYNKKSNAIEIFDTEISKASSQVKDAKLLLSISSEKLSEKGKVSKARWLRLNEQIFGPELSTDGQSIFGTIFYKSTSSNAMVFTYRDGEVNEIDFDLPVSAELFSVINQKCDSNGNVYILGYVKPTKDEEIPGIGRKRVYIIKIDARTKKARKVLVNVSANIKTVGMELSKNNELYLFGLINDGSQTITSTFSLRYNSLLQLKAKQINDIDQELFLSSFTSKEQSVFKSKRQSEYYYNIKLPIIIENSDGTFSVFLQQFYNVVQKTTSRNSNGVVTTQTTYYECTNGIVGLMFNSEGLYKAGDRLSTRRTYQVSNLNELKPTGFNSYSLNGRSSILLNHQEDHDFQQESTTNNAQYLNQISSIEFNSSGEFVQHLIYSFPSNHTATDINNYNFAAIENGESFAFTIISKNPEKHRTKKGLNFKPYEWKKTNSSLLILTGR